MDWTAVIALIREFAPMIIECFNQDKERAMDNLRKLGPFEGLRLRRGLRRQGVPVGQLDDEVRRIRSQLASASDEELLEIYEMAKESQ